MATLKQIEEIAHVTGLDQTTVRDLFTKGWSYIVEIDKMPRWERQLQRDYSPKA